MHSWQGYDLSLHGYSDLGMERPDAVSSDLCHETLISPRKMVCLEKEVSVYPGWEVLVYPGKEVLVGQMEGSGLKN